MKELKRDFARQLRKRQTETEKKVWDLLKSRRLLGLKFRRQHVIEGFVVDFYCPEHGLVIEIDGSVHDCQKDYDELRQQEIEAKFNKVIRVRNEELKDNCVVLIQRIKEAIGTRE